jgi:hypothetical protein
LIVLPDGYFVAVEPIKKRRYLESSSFSLDSLEGIVPEAKVACPVSGERLDERAVRLVAGMVVLLLAAHLFVGLVFVPALLAADFILRGWLSRKWSPLAMIARSVAKGMGDRGKKMIDVAPKIFAARMGIGFSLTLLTLQLAGLAEHVAYYIIAGMFAAAAFLEAAFAFCFGCHIYTLIQKLRSKPNHLGEGI